MGPSTSPSTARARQAPPPRPGSHSPSNTRTPHPATTSRLHQPPSLSSRPAPSPASSGAPPDAAKKAPRLPPIGAHPVAVPAATPRRVPAPGASGAAAEARAGLAALEAGGEIGGTVKRPLRAGRVLLDKALEVSVRGVAARVGATSQAQSATLTHSTTASNLRPSPLTSSTRPGSSPRRASLSCGSPRRSSISRAPSNLAPSATPRRAPHSSTGSSAALDSPSATPRASRVRPPPARVTPGGPSTTESSLGTVKQTKRALVSSTAAAPGVTRTVRKEVSQLGVRRPTPGHGEQTARKPSGGLAASRTVSAIGPPPPPSTSTRSGTLRRPTAAAPGSSIPVPSTLRPSRTLAASTAASTSKLPAIPSGRTSPLGQSSRPVSRSGSTLGDDTETEAHLRSSSAASNTAAEDSASSLGPRRPPQRRHVSATIGLGRSATNSAVGRRESWETLTSAGRPSMGSVTLSQSTASQSLPLDGDQSWETDEAQSRRDSGLPPLASANPARIPRRTDTPDGATVAEAVAADQLASALTGLSLANAHLTPGANRPARLQAPSSHSSLMYSPLSTTPLRSVRSHDFLAELSPASATPAPAARRAAKPRQSTTLEEMLKASLPGMRGAIVNGGKSLLDSSLSRQGETGEEEWWYEEGASKVMHEEIMAAGTPVRVGVGAGQEKETEAVNDALSEQVKLRELAEAVAMAQAEELARLQEEAVAAAAELAHLTAEREALVLAQQHRLSRSQRASEASADGGVSQAADEVAEAWQARVALERARGQAVRGWSKAEALWAQCADQARAERDELAVGLGVLQVLEQSLGVYARMLDGERAGLGAPLVGA